MKISAPKKAKPIRQESPMTLRKTKSVVRDMMNGEIWGLDKRLKFAEQKTDTISLHEKGERDCLEKRLHEVEVLLRRVVPLDADLLSDNLSKVTNQIEIMTERLDEAHTLLKATQDLYNGMIKNLAETRQMTAVGTEIINMAPRFRELLGEMEAARVGSAGTDIINMVAKFQAILGKLEAKAKKKK
jgi:hypothetical protein